MYRSETRRLLLVRDRKGGKDRSTILPTRVIDPLRAHLEEGKQLHESHLAAGLGAAALPFALARKYPQAGHEWGWQFFISLEHVMHEHRNPGVVSPSPGTRTLVTRAAAGLFCLAIAATAWAGTLNGKGGGVTDADTLALLAPGNVQYKIRLNQIDAPEKSRAFGQKSREALSGLVFK